MKQQTTPSPKGCINCKTLCEHRFELNYGSKYNVVAKYYLNTDNVEFVPVGTLIALYRWYYARLA